MCMYTYIYIYIYACVYVCRYVGMYMLYVFARDLRDVLFYICNASFVNKCVLTLAQEGPKRDAATRCRTVCEVYIYCNCFGRDANLTLTVDNKMVILLTCFRFWLNESDGREKWFALKFPFFFLVLICICIVYVCIYVFILCEMALWKEYYSR